MSQIPCISHQIIGGYKYPTFFHRENVEFALNYKALNTDKFVVCYPKAGTTWTQQIMSLILNNGIPENECDFMETSFLEFIGKDFVKNKVIKTHLPFELIPYNKLAKYLFVLRNSKDTCVSYYYHYISKNSQLDFHDFFHPFIEGDVSYGDYFKHVLSFWSHRFDDNFSFLIYEHMKNNTKDAVLKIAKFLGDEYVVKLQENNELILNKVLESTSFDTMKTQLKLSPYDFILRKGIVGDWRRHFNEKESELFDDKVRKLFTGTGLEELWVEEMKW